MPKWRSVSSEYLGVLDITKWIELEAACRANISGRGPDRPGICTDMCKCLFICPVMFDVVVCFWSCCLRKEHGFLLFIRKDVF